MKLHVFSVARQTSLIGGINLKPTTSDTAAGQPQLPSNDNPARGKHIRDTPRLHRPPHATHLPFAALVAGPLPLLDTMRDEQSHSSLRHVRLAETIAGSLRSKQPQPQQQGYGE